MTEPGGQSASRRWTGRCYAHLLLPVPYLTDPAVALFDEAVSAADHWRPTDTDTYTAGPVLTRTWRRPSSTDEVLLTVLAWYPLVVTVGAVPGGRAVRGARSARRAVHRAITAALSVDGRWVSDRELPHRLAAGRDRSTAARDLHRRAAVQRAELIRRSCEVCHTTTAYQATHCDRCGRRFSTAEDAARAHRYRQAVRRLAGYSAALDRLARDRPMRDPVLAGTAGEPGTAAEID